MTDSQQNAQTGSVSQLRRIDALCRQFEEAWQTGRRPQIEQVLQQAPAPDRPALLRELLSLEWAWRRRLGETLSLDEYRQRFPDQQKALADWYAEQAPIVPTTVGPKGAGAATFVNLLGLLGSSGLLTAKQRDELQRSIVPRFPDPATLLNELVRRTWLTRYQADELLKGKGEELKLGSFLKVDLLGQGGMGRVYKARHRVMDRVVALKVIQPDQLGDSQMVARFLQEVKAAAKLSHPNIVTVYDANQVGGEYYLAMELIAGIDLAKWIKQQKPAPIAQACEYARQVALGLEHAHQNRLVHRDIKPQNLMRTADGRTVKILDLGLVRRLSGTTLTKQQGTIMGTVDYMAPEQLKDSHAADERSDVYSLGATLYHFLAGRAPFADGGDFCARALCILQKEPPVLEGFRPDLPPGLGSVVRRMMAKDPAERFRTAGEVAVALEPFTRPTPPAPRPGPRAPEGRKPSPQPVPAPAKTEPLPKPGSHSTADERRRVWVWLGLLGLGVVLLGGGSWAIFLRDKQQPVDSKRAVSASPPPAPNKSDDRRAKAEPDFLQGKEFFEKKQYQLAIEAYTRAIKIDPRYAKAYFERGRAYEMVGDKQLAANDFDNAKLLDPSLSKK
jgi:serine/threonine protein kinase